jgi:hypothetical protein
LNAEGWLTQGHTDKYTVAELPMKEAQDWENITDDEWDQMFGTQMITEPSVDLLRFFNAESTTEGEVKKWASKQTAESVEEFMITFDSFDDF